MVKFKYLLTPSVDCVSGLTVDLRIYDTGQGQDSDT